MSNYCRKVFLHPFVILCGSFWQHRVCLHVFPVVLLAHPQGDGGVKSSYVS